MNINVWLAPAKINLFLHILGRRADNYHELQTAYQFLDYCDELTFRVREDRQIKLNSTIENDLVLRAARLLQERGGTSLGADISLTKRIPIGGGLGGGSSDAATTLLALNKLWDINLPETQLLELGLKLGADVPVFIQGKAAFAEGIGEKLTPISIPEPWYVVLAPPQNISTAEFFSAPELTRNTRPITIQEFLAGKTRTHNDFEPLLKKLCPVVAEALDWLNHFAPARLTGSGGCVFATVETKAQAHKIAENVPKQFKAFVAKGVNCLKR